MKLAIGFRFLRLSAVHTGHAGWAFVASNFVLLLVERTPRVTHPFAPRCLRGTAMTRQCTRDVKNRIENVSMVSKARLSPYTEEREHVSGTK